MPTVGETWSRVSVNGKSADVFTPSGGVASRQALIFLHDHDGQTLAGAAAFSSEFERYGLRVVCPHGGRSWWTDVVCREFDPAVAPLTFLRNSVVPWIERAWDVRPPMIGLTGIGMGGQGALQLAYRHPREFPVVAAISPTVDFHIWHGRGSCLDEMFRSREAARQETATLQLHPLNWPRHQLLVCDPADRDWFEGTDRLAMKLASSGVMFEADLTTSHGGHCWQYFDAMAKPVVEFLVARLEQVSRAV